MLVLSWFKIIILFIKFLNFVLNYKVYLILKNIKIYNIVLIYFNILKLYYIFLYFLKLNKKVFKIFLGSKILKLNLLYNIKKVIYSFIIYNYFKKFVLLNQL